MIICIVLITLVVIGIGFILSEWFYIDKDTVYVYNEKGKNHCPGYKFSYHPAKSKIPQNVEIQDNVLYPCDIVHTKRIKKEEYFSIETRGSIGIAVSGILGFVLLICLGAIIGIHSNIAMTNCETSYQTRIDDLQYQKATILSYKDNQFVINKTDDTAYHVVIVNSSGVLPMINNYNSGVIDLKKDLYLEKIKLDSPWINWFVNPAFTNVEGYNSAATNYKTVLGDTLRIFDYNN